MARTLIESMVAKESRGQAGLGLCSESTQRSNCELVCHWLAVHVRHQYFCAQKCRKSSHMTKAAATASIDWLVRSPLVVVLRHWLIHRGSCANFLLCVLMIAMRINQKFCTDKKWAQVLLVRVLLRAFSQSFIYLCRLHDGLLRKIGSTGDSLMQQKKKIWIWITTRWSTTVFLLRSFKLIWRPSCLQTVNLNPKIASGCS